MDLGREAEARAEAEAEALLGQVPEFTLRQWAMAQPYQNPATLEQVVATFRAAGLPD